MTEEKDIMLFKIPVLGTDFHSWKDKEFFEKITKSTFWEQTGFFISLLNNSFIYRHSSSYYIDR